MNRPCIRGLKEFKKGCPEKCWNGNEGCPAWKEYTIKDNKDGGIKIIKDCIDNLQEIWAFESLKLLEGNQIATESFRNGMTEEIDGKIYPKPDRGIVNLVSMIYEQQKNNHLLDHANTRKQLTEIKEEEQ